MPTLDDAQSALERHFGFSRFREGQADVIEAVLAGQDVIVVMPTGGGKSLCYQLPSLLLPRPTVVVSPLLALLEDQYLKLQQLGIPAVRLDSTVGAADRRAALARIARGVQKPALCSRALADLDAWIGAAVPDAAE